MQAAAGDDLTLPVVVHDHDEVPDVLEQVLGAARQHQVLGGEVVHEAEQRLHVRDERLADREPDLLVPVQLVRVGHPGPLPLRELPRGGVDAVIAHGTPLNGATALGR